MSEQADLLLQAHDSLAAAKLLHSQGYHGFADSRAYYTMSYIAEAFLLGQGMAFSRHSGVHAAFGEHFVKTGAVPSEFHRYLIRGMEVRKNHGHTARSVAADRPCRGIFHPRRTPHRASPAS
jgi:uncharacterized protein (UPF0332 family)